MGYIKLVRINQGLAEVLIIFIKGLHLLNLLNLDKYYTFKLFGQVHQAFRQVKQVQASNKYYEYLCRPLIDTYKLAVTRQYFYLVKLKFCRGKKSSNFQESFSALGEIIHIQITALQSTELHCTAQNFTHCTALKLHFTI